MSFYKLWTSRAADSPEEVAIYFEDDIEYVVGVARSIGMDVNPIKDRAEDCVDAIRSEDPERLDPDAERLVASIFVGDAEWNEPLAEWLPWMTRKVLMMTDGLAREKALEIARRYGSLHDIGMPPYSTPANCMIEGRSPLELLDIPRYRMKERAMKRSVIACSVLDLEWFAYICRENDLNLDEGLVEETRRQSLAYFTGRREELHDDVRGFQAALFKNAAEWIKEVKEDFDMRSVALHNVVERFERVIEEDLGGK